MHLREAKKRYDLTMSSLCLSRAEYFSTMAAFLGIPMVVLDADHMADKTAGGHLLVTPTSGVACQHFKLDLSEVVSYLMKPKRGAFPIVLVSSPEGMESLSPCQWSFLPMPCTSVVDAIRKQFRVDESVRHSSDTFLPPARSARPPEVESKRTWSGVVSSPTLHSGSASVRPQRRCLKMPLLEKGPTSSTATRNTSTPGRGSASPKQPARSARPSGVERKRARSIEEPSATSRPRSGTRTGSANGGPDKRSLRKPLLKEGRTASAATRNASTPGRGSASPKQEEEVVGRAATKAERLALKTREKRAAPNGDSAPGGDGQTPEQNKLLKSQVCDYRKMVHQHMRKQECVCIWS